MAGMKSRTCTWKCDVGGCRDGGNTWWKWINTIVFTGCSWGDVGISRVGTTEKKDSLFIFSAAGGRSQLIGFLDDSFTLKRAIYVPLSSLSRGEGWSGSLILAGSRGLDLWWHINWAVPLKKRKASVAIGPALFVELWKLVLFGWKALRCLFTPQNVSNGGWLSFCMWVCVSLRACLDAYMLCLLAYECASCEACER